MRKTFFGVVLVVVSIPLWNAHAASTGGELYMTPTSELRTVGEPFDVRLYANTNGQTVNAVESELAYDPSTLSVESISLEGSILTSWATAPSYDSAQGIIRFSGWAAQPFTGSDGLLVTVTFRPLRVGQSGVDFNSASMLAADGRGGNIITTMRSGVFRIQPLQKQPTVNLPPTPDTTDASSTVRADSLPQSPRPDAPSSSTDQTQLRTIGQSDAAALVLSGVALAPIIIPFLLLLVCIAFGIAYVLHRFVR